MVPTRKRKEPLREQMDRKVLWYTRNVAQNILILFDKTTITQHTTNYWVMTHGVIAGLLPSNCQFIG